MSGVEAVRILKAGRETSRIPVLALSAAAAVRDRQRGLEAGFDRYLTKPVNVEELVAAIDELLLQDLHP